MKKIVFIICCMLLVSGSLLAQSVGIGTAAPHASAQLDISSNAKGLLLPRMNSNTINSVSNPAKGLIIYDSSINQLVINIGTPAVRNWQPVSYNAWGTMGNAGTNSFNHFIGTTDAAPLRFRINNIPAGSIDSISESTYLGYRAGANFTGYANTAMGFKSLYSNASGGGNSAFGVYSLYKNTSGFHNTAIGNIALSENTTGYRNSAVGDVALSSNTTGSDNVAIGSQSLFSNTSGNKNTAVGSEALWKNTTGSFNSALGVMSLDKNTTGTYNAATGFGTLYNNETGHDNAAYGAFALYNNILASFNTAIGNATLYYNTTGDNNAALGAYSLFFNTSGYNNSAVGFRALNGNTTGYYNTALGDGSLYSNYSGVGNTAAGSGALYYTNYSSYNTMFGYHAGFEYDLGWNNTFIGASSNATAHGIYNSIALGNNVVIYASNTAKVGNFATASIGGYASWTNYSDGRFKKNIREDVAGIDFIMKLRPVTYQLDVASLSKQLNESAGKSADENMRLAMLEKERVIQSGFIAQEVEQAAKATGYDFSGVDKPKNEKDSYGLRYAEFVVPLVKAMQEQQQMINDLKKVNADLQKRVADLERR